MPPLPDGGKALRGRGTAPEVSKEELSLTVGQLWSLDSVYGRGLPGCLLLESRGAFEAASAPSGATRRQRPYGRGSDFGWSGGSPSIARA